MKIWQILVLGLPGLALAGCHSDPEVAYLRRDNLAKEREIERLRNQIEDMEAAPGSASLVRPRILQGLPPGEMPPEPGFTDGRRTVPAATRPGPALAPPARRESEPDISPPDISPGMEVKPGVIPERLRIPDGSGPERQIAPPGLPSSGGRSQWILPDGRPPLAVARMDNRSVAQITLHPALTGGIGTGGRLGDEGLLVVVEPRDFAGNIISAPGDISVALLDPALPGEQARLARWDFNAADTQGMIRTGSQQGIHLKLPWTSSPAHDRLKVFVRYTTRDGRKLQAERLVGVALEGPPPLRRATLPEVAPAESASRPQWSPVR